MALDFEKTVFEISKIVNGSITGEPNIIIKSLNRIEDAQIGDLTFFASQKYEKYLSTTKASCILVPEDLSSGPAINQAYIRVKDPYLEFIKLLKYIEAGYNKLSSFIHPTAIIGDSSKVDISAYIGPYCVIGNHCVIEKNTVLDSNITIYDNCIIGEGSVIHSQVVLCSDTVIGKNCLIHPGAKIGSDGFGFIEHKDGTFEKIPQLGNVLIGDNVEIGANTTIDRAVIGSTVIENGVKLDNLIHVAHNARIGENSGLAAQVGISGSTKVGKRNRFGGQVGLAGHLDTADDVSIQAQGGVAKSIKEKGIYFGSPVKERLLAFKIEAALHQLPELLTDFRKFRKIVFEKLGLTE